MDSSCATYLGAVFRAAALSRFARTLGTLAKSGVSLLPALKSSRTPSEPVLAKVVAQVAEETRGGDSLGRRCASCAFPKDRHPDD